jgi:tetratricopeptide (TPR) repeat protein
MQSIDVQTTRCEPYIMMHRKRFKNSAEWDPPAPSTVYIKIENIPYETFKTRLYQGLVTTELDQIRYRLDRRIYCCGVCSKYVNGYCVVTNRKAESEWICKSFIPKEEFIHLDAWPGNECSASYRYLSETGLRKDIKGNDKKTRNEDREEAGEQQNIDVEDLYEEGVALYMQGKLKLALEAFENVLLESPKHFAALFHKGNSLLKLKCFEEALGTFDKAAGINPGHAGLWNNMGYAFMKLERFRQALEAFERSISQNPVQKSAWEGKEAVLSLIRRSEEDLEESEKALRKNPSDTCALFEKGKLHMRLGELEQARETFEKALEIKPENHKAWQLRGKVLFETGMEKEALHAFEKAIRQKPDFPEAWYEKGRVFLTLDNPKSAENAFKIAANLWESKGLKKKAEMALQRVKKLHSGEK